MPTNTLGPGTPGVLPVTQVADYTYAGVATRKMAAGPPTDADWGASPPPDCTMVVSIDGFLWVRLNGVWCYAELKQPTL